MVKEGKEGHLHASIDAGRCIVQARKCSHSIKSLVKESAPAREWSESGSKSGKSHEALKN